MTIEQKAKAYDVAIKALRSLFAEQAIKHCDRVYIKDITNIFPEFKESEDERTWIINYLSNRILNSTIIAEKENLKKAISWLEAQGEQKPAWSEEDEEIHRKCIRAMRASACGFPEEEKFVKQVDNWLNSLKNRVGSFDGGYKVGFSAAKHNQWRPSDEQIEALKEAVDEHFDIDGGALWHLYEDLKKLKE